MKLCTPCTMVGKPVCHLSAISSANRLAARHQHPPCAARLPGKRRRRWQCQECSAAAATPGKGFAPAAPAPPEQAGASAALLPPAPDLQGKAVRANWNATALAYLGDSVWELYVRRHYFFPPSRLTHYYEGVASQVRAETQESYYELLHAGGFLSEAETEVLAWGRNARVSVPPRFKASGSHAVTYKRATAVECLVGYLYLTDAPRLHQLMHHLGISGDCSGGRAAISL